MYVGRGIKSGPTMTFTRRQGYIMNDPSGIESVIQAFYEVISGSAGTNREWDKVRALFCPGASLVPSSVVCGSSPPSAISLESCIQRLAGFLSQHDFFETGFIHRMEVYGNIASVISTYEAFRAANGSEPGKRGMNFIQMLRDGNRWRITSMIWRDEDKDNSIPEKYRKPAGAPQIGRGATHPATRHAVTR